MHALRNISKLGKITYHALGFSGDNVVKTEVIANYLKAEVESAAKGTVRRVDLRPQNYKFKYKGTQDWNGRQVYVLHVNPREKKVGLFKGELWLDAETYMPVRETGLLREIALVHVEEDAVRARLRAPERRFGAATHRKPGGNAFLREGGVEHQLPDVLQRSPRRPAPTTPRRLADAGSRAMQQ